MKTKLLLLLLLANFSIYAQINLVPNAGLETWTSNIPANWTVSNSVYRATDVVTGRYSALLSYVNASPKITAQVPMKAGVTYTVKYKYKYLSANYGGDHPIALNISKTGSATTLSSSAFASNNLWTEKETTFTPDQDLSYDLSISTFSFDSKAFDVLIDDVQVFVKGTEQYTLIPNLEFEKALIALGIDSGTTDGKVLTLNVKTVKVLRINPLVVSDVTGIQDFEALEELNCNGTYTGTGNGLLTKLDLSKNLNLTTLYCSSNQLTALDLSKNVALVTLECGSNKLTTVDLSKNLNLSSANFEYNQITSIDVSKNLSLKTLKVQNNSLASINLTNNTALTYLDCGNNKLTALDLTNNTLLNDLTISNLSTLTAKTIDLSKNLNLATLYCNSSGFTSLDLSKNVNLAKLYCFTNKLTTLDLSNNINLTNLNCSSNLLTSLDVSKNTKLTDFTCNENQLTTLDVSKNNALRFFAAQTNQLTSLNLKNGKNTLITTQNFYLEGNPKLSCITVDDIAYANANWGTKKDPDTYFSNFDCSTTTPISDPAFEDKLIDLGIDTDTKNGLVLNASIASLTSLDVSNSAIKDLNGIQGFTALKSLNASGNLLSKVDLSKNTALNTLTISNNPTLTCIKVADVVAAGNWNTTKDATASFSLDCNFYTLIPDSKFEDKLIALGIDKDGKNGKVSTDRVVNITTLDLSNSGIADLTGIQDFVNLTSLNCTGSSSTGTGTLTKLDVSKNTKLTVLNCIYNQLTTLDVTQNTLLKSLNVGANQLTTLDVTKNPALTDLYVHQNKLTTVDVTKNTGLIYLSFESNDLASIDLTQNTKLINLRLLGNELTTIDVSKNTLLNSLDVRSNKLTALDLSKNLELGDLYCSDNQLATLDVSKSIKLNTLKCEDNKLTALNITKNTALTTLNCSSNKLTTVDFSQNLDLTDLDCGGNSLTTLDVSKNIKLSTLRCQAIPTLTSLDLSKNTELKSLTCYSSNLTSLDLSKNGKLTYFLCYLNKLSSLNLQNGNNKAITTFNTTNSPNLNCILVDDVNYSKTNWSNKSANSYFSSIDCALTTFIADAKFEQKLIDLGIDTDGKNGVVLTSSIKTVTSLDVSNSAITDLTGIEAFTSLTNLNVSNNALSNLDLSKNSALNTLNVATNAALNCIKVADVALVNNWTVTKDATTNFSLDCRPYTLIPDLNFEKKLIDLGIDTDGENGKVLTASISSLTSLNVPYSSISDLTGIEDFKAITTLTISTNKLTKVDISKNTALETVFLQNNQLTTIDLSKNVSLRTINLDNNKLASLDISKNTALTSLNCNYNNLTSLDVSNNVNLYTLSITNNNLTSLNLSQNANLRDLYVSYNVLTALDVSKNPKLFNFFGYNNKLTSLDLSQNPSLNEVLIEDNSLVNLNLKNGKNTSLTGTNGGVRLYNNPNLTCILVDDVQYSNTNWATKKDASAIFSSVACPVNVAYTKIPDANFENKLIALGIDTDGPNGKVATANIATLKTLNISNSNISDLTGIEDFAALNTLDCSKNQLKAVAFAKNKSLTKINCSQNQLSELNVSTNTILTSLSCGSNNILVLDVSKNTQLTILNASFNKLTSLDVSKNTALKELDCASNNLFSLNLKNGNNANMQNMIFGNFTQNPKLLCIQVDDAAFSDQKWIAKDASAVYSTTECPVNVQYTLIPDPNFEKKLISLGIDSGAVDGQVLTSSIIGIKQLTIHEAVADLTGIEDFASLESLDCSNGGALAKLDVSKNSNLKTLICGTNALTTLDVSKNLNLKTLDASYNNLTSIDVSKNVALDYLRVSSNQITTVDISKNVLLTSLAVRANKLTSLDLSQNLILASLEASNNQFTTIDITKNTALTYVAVTTNQLTGINVSKNVALKTLDVASNKIETLDVSQNPALTYLMANNNQLTSLNLKNGKNNLLTNINVSFTSNSKLTCILVDDVMYANTNWLNRKDVTATYNTECTGELILPANNFAIETKGESCLGQNNGEISITAKQTFAYVATINGKATAFTNNALKVTALTPGNYAITITIPGQIFEQNFNVTIQKGATITGKSSVSAKKVDVEITEGTAPFTVFIDGQAQFETSDTNFSLDLEKGGLLEVATSKACEGVYSKKIATLDLFGTLAAYPNPTSGSFEIEIPTQDKEVTIELYNFGGQLVSAKNYAIENGKVQLSLENQPSGIYAAKIYFETPEYIKIIKK